MAVANAHSDSGARRARTLKYGTNVVLGTVLLLVILLALNWFAERSQQRLDLTADKQYTVSAATINLLQTLKDRVIVTVYATQKDTPPEWTEQRNQLRNLLQEYRRRSDGRVQFAFRDPSADSKVEEQAKKAGIQPQEMGQASMTEFSVKLGYLGFIVEYKGKTEPVPFIRPESSLEYQLTRAINKVAQVNIPTIGVLAPMGNPMMGQQSEYGFINNILEQEGFTVRSLTAESLGDLSEIKLLMIFDPQELSEEALFKIDQFVMNGGKLFVAAAGTEIGGRGAPRATPKEPNINSILEHYGVRIDDNLVEDWKNGIPQNAITNSGQLVRFLNPFLMRVTALSEDNPITKNLRKTGMFFVFPSTISKSAQGTSGTLEVLAETSERTRVQEEFFTLEPTKLQPPTPEENPSPKNLIVSVTGPLASRFASVDPPTLSNDDGTTRAVPQSEIKTQSSPEAQVIIASSAASFSDSAIERFNPNVIFPINVAEALTRGGDLLALRGKEVSFPALGEVTERQAVITQVLVLVGVPAVLLVLGLVKLFLNRRRRARYRRIYAGASA